MPNVLSLAELERERRIAVANHAPDVVLNSLDMIIASHNAMQRALVRIGAPESCGCACTSVCACNSREALAIWKEEAKQVATDALPAGMGGWYDPR